jgi:hypothetical protein
MYYVERTGCYPKEWKVVHRFSGQGNRRVFYETREEAEREAARRNLLKEEHKEPAKRIWDELHLDVDSVPDATWIEYGVISVGNEKGD